jgi:small nuclear ribonucleoprotein (snRNP)-like protein
MSKTQVTAEVDIDFAEGKRTIRMVLKQPSDIEDCIEGTVVLITLKNTETYTGIFKRFDDDDCIILDSLSGTRTIGLERHWVDYYFEEVGTI